LTYIPDAKAVTDAPDRLMVLIKQRRRWMNGALFAAWRVIFNAGRMIGFTGKSTHPTYRSIGMMVFMTYYLLNQCLQLVIVGQYFISIKMFFVNEFSAHATDISSDWTVIKFFT
jgi:chitin synthase